jgi:hypothetical protein
MKSTYRASPLLACKEVALTRRKVRSLAALLALGSLAFSPAFAQINREPQPLFYDASRIAQYSDLELIDLLSAPSFKENVHSHGIYSMLPPDRRQTEAPAMTSSAHVFHLDVDEHELGFAVDVERELIRRRPIDELMSVFEHTSDRAQRAWMIDVLAQIRNAKVDMALRPFVTTDEDDTNYLALKYFAESCDPSALAILNRNYFKYGVSSMEWASIVRVFGACRYAPAVQNLVASLGAASLDLGFAAHASLSEIYPDAHISFSDSMDAQRQWTSYVRDHP